MHLLSQTAAGGLGCSAKTFRMQHCCPGQLSTPLTQFSLASISFEYIMALADRLIHSAWTSQYDSQIAK